MNPTEEIYTELQQAYENFNAKLFENKLPMSMITLQREKNTYGYFSAQRFSNHEGETTDEIALNPAFFAIIPLLEIMQTLVHEMCHQFQHHYGKPGRARYHNAEWARMMTDRGLMPSQTGKPGGKKTGDRMNDYPIEGGIFLSACNDLLTQQFQISWYDRFVLESNVKPAEEHPESLGLPENGTKVNGNANLVRIVRNKSNRIKYTCRCKTKIWGKPGLQVTCGVCHSQFQENTNEQHQHNT